MLASPRLAVRAQGLPAPAPGRPRLPRVSRSDRSKRPPVFARFLGHLPGRLAVVAGFTQALQVAPVDKAGPVPSVGRDVIHHRGPGTPAVPGTLPAPRLRHELTGPQVVRPDGQAVPAVPLGGHPALRPLGLVLGAVSLAGERPASRVPAGSERLHGHGLSPPGKTKSRHRRPPVSGWIIGTGSESTGPVRYPPSSPSGSPGSRR